MGKSILLTGYPGCGKTTIIHNLISMLDCPMGGFFTQEIRDKGIRQGFEIISLDGVRGTLSHVNFDSPYRVGKYGVNIHAIESLAVPAINSAIDQGYLVIIDEIGPMEIKSRLFCQTVVKVIESKSVVLGTIVKRSSQFTDMIKSRPEVRIIEVTRNNREYLVQEIFQEIQETIQV